jgi:hypothetical protein
MLSVHSLPEIRLYTPGVFFKQPVARKELAQIDGQAKTKGK